MFFRVFLLALGAACVLLGGVLLFSWYGQTRTAPGAAATHVETQAETHADVRGPVLAAARPIARGALLRQGDIVTKTLKPNESLLPGSLAPGQEKDFVGAMTRRDFAAGEPLIASEFVKPSDRSFLAAVLRPGFRAMSIFVDAAQSVAGLALPGDFVDVILVQTFDDKMLGKGTWHAGETVLSGARVLALDQAMSAPSGVLAAVSPENRVPKTVTLEVTEQQAKTLLVASKMGSFGLSLLPLDASDESNAPSDRQSSGTVWSTNVSHAFTTAAVIQLAREAAEADARARQEANAKAGPNCLPATGSALDKSVRCAPTKARSLPARDEAGPPLVPPDNGVPWPFPLRRPFEMRGASIIVRDAPDSAPGGGADD